MADVFISYHDKTNGDRAEKIAATLESAGISCWYARRDVPAGGDFTHEVIKQIGNCTVFLLLLDDGAARSPHVETEVANAFGHKKIMPYQTDKKDVKRVKWVQYYLKQIQIVPFSDYDTLTKEVATALARPVKTVTPKPHHTKSKPETKVSLSPLEGCIIAAMLLLVIWLSIEGFRLVRDESSNWVDWPEKLSSDNFFKGVLGIFMGYYAGGFLSWGIIGFFSEEYANNLHLAKKFLQDIMLVWLLFALLLGGIIGYRANGISGVMICLALVLALCFFQVMIKESN